MIEMEIYRLVWDEHQNSPIVLLIDKTEATSVLPIWIGNNEAQAIAMGLAGKKYVRPLTHDLVRLIVDGLGGVLLRVEINAMENSTYYARLIINRENEIISIDARPSDAIAIAVRTGAPILVSDSINRYQLEDILNESNTKENQPNEEERAERLRKIISHMHPEEFGNVE
jgi:uncharacterized protein